MSKGIIHDFLQAIGLIGRGRTHEKLNDEMARLIQAMQDHPEDKASGSITLTMKFTKLVDRIDLQPEIKTVLPKEKGLASATFWPAEGGLSVEHPSQHDMFGGPRETSSRGGDRNFA